MNILESIESMATVRWPTYDDGVGRAFLRDIRASVPPEVAEAALLMRGSSLFRDDTQLAIAVAIMEERRRCARLADKHGSAKIAAIINGETNG